MINWIMLQFAESPLFSTILRLLLAGLFGGLIGIERGRRHQPAGMRTHMLVCMGSALVMITSQSIIPQYGAVDPTRMGAQVISGIGFLGVGTIIVDRQQQVRGLTTAAGLWASACMGLAIGVGFYSGAIVACILILLTISIINKFEQFIVAKSQKMDVYVEFDDLGGANEFLMSMAENRIKVISFEIVRPKNNDNIERLCVALNLSLQLPKKHLHSDVIKALDNAQRLRYIEEI